MINLLSESFRKRFWLTLMLVLWGLTLSSLVGAEGSFGWRLLRIAAVLVVTAAAYFLSIRIPRLGAVLVIILGSIALSIAVVFGFYHLMKAGVTWRVVMGLLDLLIGVVLLVLASRRLFSGIARGWLFLTVPVLFIVVLVIIWTIMPAVLATNVPRIPVGKKTPADFGLSAQQVRFAASDGVELGGWYIPSTNKSTKVPAIVLRHGSGSTGSDVLAQAAILSRHGYSVLIADARGHGLSSGRAMDFGWYGNADINGAISFLVKQVNVDIKRIAVVGFSMGGEEAIGALADDARISAVIAEGATARTDADKIWLQEAYGFRGRIQMGLEWIQYSLTDLLTEAKKPLALSDAVRVAAPRPVLLITAGEVEDELYAAKYMQQHSPSTVTIWTVPGAEHIQGLSVSPADWERMVIDFLDDSLIR
jgi:uncharacterized protein